MRGNLARLRHAVGRGVHKVDPRLTDLALVGVLLIAAAAEVAITRRPIGLRLLPIAFTILPLLLRRRLPAAMFALQFGAALVTLAPPLFTSLVAFFVGMYSIGVHARRRWLSLAAPLAGALILAVVGIPLDFTTPPFSAWSAALIGGVGLWLLGSTVHGAGERSRQEEEQRALARRVAASGERARIARELHDAVAHRVSLTVIQAGAARTVLDREPDRARESVAAAERSARAALEELRGVVGLLDERNQVALAPQPGLQSLEELVDRIEGAGLPVTVRREGTLRPPSPGVDLLAYRILQEGLTNALRHGRGGRTEVIVRAAPAALELEIRNGPPRRPREPVDGAGRGLIGMRERVAIAGGTLRAGPSADGGFDVVARLPLGSR